MKYWVSKKNAIIGWGLYFEKKRNFEKILSISKSTGHGVTFTMVKEWG